MKSKIQRRFWQKAERQKAAASIKNPLPLPLLSSVWLALITACLHGCSDLFAAQLGINSSWVHIKYLMEMHEALGHLSDSVSGKINQTGIGKIWGFQDFCRYFLFCPGERSCTKSVMCQQFHQFKSTYSNVILQYLVSFPCISPIKCELKKGVSVMMETHSE